MCNFFLIQPCLIFFVAVNLTVAAFWCNKQCLVDFIILYI